jgi:hypothetical protein
MHQMAITVTEKLDSRRLTTGKNAMLELSLNVFGTDSENEAKIAATNATPGAWGSLSNPPLLFRQAIQLEVVGPNLWLATVRYDTTGTQPLSAEDSFEFDTSGGTQHVTQSIDTVGIYAAPGFIAPDFQGAIGVTQNGVDGVDIVVPVFNFSETHRFPEISPAYKGGLFQATGKINNKTFRGFSPGEVLFLGASGNRRDSDPETPWELTYRFAAQPNRDGIQVGAISGIAKLGWDYMWVRYMESEDDAAKSLIKRPVAVYVEQVYESIDFSILGLN